MKQKTKQLIILTLKELDLYKRVDPTINFKLGNNTPFEVTSPIYIRLNDVIDWGELIR